MIAHNKPQISEKDQAAVQAVLQSGWVAEGPMVEKLEHQFCQMNGGGAATAVSSGTAALFLALQGLGIGQGHFVAVPSYACSALLNAVKMTGAEPVPVDVQADDFTIAPEALANQKVDIQAVIAVHTFGATANITALQDVVPLVLEDCCQSLGGPQGKQGAAAIYSFYATKVITGGQGGLVWDASGSVAERIRDYREFDCRSTYEPRFNLQMTDIQAALIVSQFNRLQDIVSRRQDIRRRYIDAVSPLLKAGWKLQGGLDDDHMPYRCVLIAPDEASRDTLKTTLMENGVGVIVPVEKFELLHNYLNLSEKDFPVSEMLARTTLSLPLYPSLTGNEVDQVCRILENAQ